MYNTMLPLCIIFENRNPVITALLLQLLEWFYAFFFFNILKSSQYDLLTNSVKMSVREDEAVSDQHNSSSVVMRSASMPDVTSPMKLTEAATINAEPQNFVVVGGQKYRIKRNNSYSTETYVDQLSPTSVGTADSSLTRPRHSDEMAALKTSLKQWESKAKSQDVQLEYQAHKIAYLEGLLRKLGVEEDTIHKSVPLPTASAKSHKQPMARKTHLDLVTHMDEQESGFLAAKTAPAAVLHGISSHKSIDYITPKTTDRKFFDTPSSTDSPSSQGESSTVCSGITDILPCEDSAVKDNHVALSQPQAISGSPSRNGLEARLSMTSNERRKFQSAVSSSRSKFSRHQISKDVTTNNSTHPLSRQSSNDSDDFCIASPALLSLEKKAVPSNPNAFKWKHQIKAKGPFLFIAHDNPQLGKTISSLIDSASTMNVILESHENKDTARFVFGNIVFSGSFHEIEDANLVDELRGASCLVVNQLRAVKGNLKNFPTRGKPNSDIVELDFSGKSGDVESVDISTSEKLSSFLRPCQARVDVILDPYHDGLQWFPYYEGRRKMAPQFRSKGIGYLRLGDDMSNFGTAFLSMDAGYTYLDNNEARNILSKSMNNLSSMNSTLTAKTPSEDKKSLTNSIRSMVHSVRGNANEERNQDLLTQDVMQISNRNIMDDNTISFLGDKLSELLRKFEGEGLKWSDKVETLQGVTQHLEHIHGCQSMDKFFSKCSHVVLSIFTRLFELLSKQQNPNVTVAAVKILAPFASVPNIGCATTSNSSFALPWRNLILEIFNLLRASHKQVQDITSQVLHCLHGSNTLSWQVVSGCINEIVTGGKVGSAGNNSASTANKKKVAVGVNTTANTSKVVGWFVTALQQDLKRVFTVHNQILGMIGNSGKANNEYCGMLLKGFAMLLSHREEVTRDVAIQAIGSAVAWEIITTLFSLCHQHMQSIATKLGKLCSIKNMGIDHEDLIMTYSDASYTVLKDILTTFPAKVTDKIASCLLLLLQACLNECTTFISLHPSSQNATSSTPKTSPRPNLYHRPISSSTAVSATGEGNSPYSTGSGATTSDEIEPENTSPAPDDDKNTIRENTRLLRSRGGSRTLSRNNSFGKVSPRPPPPKGLDTTSAASTQVQMQNLSNQWFETKLLFKTIPSNESQWEQAFAVSKNATVKLCEKLICNNFCRHVDNLLAYLRSLRVWQIVAKSL